MTAGAHQTPRTRNLDRGDHVWIRVPITDGRGKDLVVFKCCTCGAVCRTCPPPHPTPDDWLPDRWERLTAEERGQCPQTNSR